MKRLRRPWLWGGVVLFAIVCFFLVRHEIEAKLDPKVVSEQLTKAIGFPVHAENIKLGLTGDLSFINVQLEDEGKPFLSARSILVRLRFLPLLRGKVVIKSILADSPAVGLNQKSANRLLAKLQGVHGPSLQIPVAISHGTFLYTGENGKSIALNGVAGSIINSSPNPLVSLSFNDRGGGRYTVSGSVGPAAINLQGTAKKGSLAEIVNPFGIRPIPEFQGALDGTFTLAGKMEDLGINGDFSVDSGLFKGNATLSSFLTSNGSERFLHGKLYSGKGQLAGFGEFKSLGMTFRALKQNFIVQDGTLEFPSGIVQFGGKIEKSKQLSLRFSTKGFDPFSLPNFSGWGIQGSSGIGEGMVSGTFPNLTMKASAHFPAISMSQSVLKNVRVTVGALLSSQKARLTQFLVQTNGTPLSLKGEIGWDDARNIDLRLSKLNAKELAQLFGLERKLAPIQMILAGRVHYDRKSESWKGTVTAPAGQVVGEKFDRFQGTFSYQQKQPVLFSGTFDMKGRTAVISGDWKNGVGSFKLDADGFPMEQLPFLSNAVRDFRGIVSIHARYLTEKGGQSQVDFSLPKATYKGKPFPAVSGTLSGQGETLRFSPLNFTGLSPALSVSGEYHLDSKAMDFQGKLNGQNPGDLLAAFPGKIPRMSGNLYGPFHVSGVYPNVALDFNGDVRQAHFQGFTLPLGHLVLQGSLPSRFKIDFETNQFSLADFPLVHQFMPSLSGTGTLKVVSNPPAPGMNVSFRLNNTALNGKSLGPMEGSLVYRAPLVRVTHLAVPLTSPPLSVSGGINLEKKSVDLHSTLQGQSIAELAKVTGKTLGKIDGNLYGDVAISGSYPNVKLAFSGEGKNLVFSNMQLGDVTLSLTGTRTPHGYALTARGSHIQASRISALQKALPGISGELAFSAIASGSIVQSLNFELKKASWKGKAFPAFRGTLAWNDPIAKFSRFEIEGLTPPLSAAGEINTQNHQFHFSSNLQGQRVGELMKLMGVAAGNVDARLYGPLTASGTTDQMHVSFSGTGNGLKFNNLSLGSGHLALQGDSDAQKHFALHVTGSGIPAGSVQFLAQNFPGISGNVGFDVHLNTGNPNQATLDFGLSNASSHGRSFPELTGHAVWNAPQLLLSPLSAKLSPPLSVSGEINTQQKSIHLSGNLEGQAIADLLMLTGGASSQVNGRMYGPLVISGPSSSPQADFHGSVTSLEYRGIKIGDGKLDLVVSHSAINGKLVLNRPVSLDTNNSVFGGIIQQIPGIGNVLGNLTTNVILTGVIIRGTPQHPDVTPTFRQGAARATPSANPTPAAKPANQNPVMDILQQILKGQH